MHYLELVQKLSNILARLHFYSEREVDSLELCDFAKGLVHSSKVFRVGKFVRAFIGVQVKEVAGAEPAKLIHDAPLFVFVDLYLVEIHVL